MSSKKYLFAAAMLAVGLAASGYYYFSKQGQEKIRVGSRGQQQEVVQEFLQSADPDLVESAKLAQAEEPVLSSFALVERAFSVGEIDVDTMVKLKILAVFAPDLLPAKWQGANLKRLEGDNLIAELEYYQPQLSDNTKELVNPFLLPPTAADSFFNPENKSKRRQMLQKIAESL